MMMLFYTFVNMPTIKHVLELGVTFIYHVNAIVRIER